LRLYEYEAKKLFSLSGIPVTAGEVVETKDRAKAFAEKLGKPVILKAQILSGGRGKAGGVKFAQTPKEAEERAEELFATKIKGFPVNKILVDEKLEIEEEFYLGVTLDRVNYKLVMLACSEGGVEIEEIARKKPEKIRKISVDVDQEFYPFWGNSMAGWLGAKGRSTR
jgi:succinyl-CoA synthetase beta subunit